MTTTQPIAERLTYAWEPCDGGRLLLTVTEHRPRKPKTTRYVVEEEPRVSGGRVFLVAKHPDETGPRSDEVYSVFVGAGRWACTCPGSSCRDHEIQCRHVRAVRAGFGVVFV